MPKIALVNQEMTKFKAQIKKKRKNNLITKFEPISILALLLKRMLRFSKLNLITIFFEYFLMLLLILLKLIR